MRLSCAVMILGSLLALLLQSLVKFYQFVLVPFQTAELYVQQSAAVLPAPPQHNIFSLSELLTS